QTIAALPAPPATVVAILRDGSPAIATAVHTAGSLNTPLPPGLTGGQTVDIEPQGKTPTAEPVESIHRATTRTLPTTTSLPGSPPLTPLAQYRVERKNSPRNWPEALGLLSTRLNSTGAPSFAPLRRVGCTPPTNP